MSRTNTTWPRNYADADRMLHYRQDPTSREVASRKIANNSWLVRDGDAIAVVLHSTAVVVWTPDGRVQLSTGGWDTPITRDRIHGCVPRGVTVGRVKGVTTLTAHTGWRYDRDAHPDHPVRTGERLPNGRYRRCDPASCTDRYHRGTPVSDGVWRGEFRDGISFHIDDPAGTVEYGTPRRVPPPSRPRSRYPDNYYGFTVYGHTPPNPLWARPAPRELTQAERLDALRREVAALHREADRARDPEFPYSAADAEYGETYQAVELVPAGGEMPPAAPVWTPADRATAWGWS